MAEQARRLVARSRSWSGTPAARAMAADAVARAVVPGREEMDWAVRASQIFVRTRGECGVCRALKERARVFWVDILFWEVRR
jgi:hypothetical protein